METNPASRTRHASSTQRLFEDFDAVSKWRREENRDTIEIYLPGFKREQLKIHINHYGILVISAERYVEGNKWKRFRKEIEVPRNCDTDAIHANFVNNILSVVMPKKHITPVSKNDQEDQIPELEEVDDQEENQSPKHKGQGTTEEETKHKGKKELGKEDHYHHAEYKFEEDHAELTPEATRDVAFKFFVVVIVILVIASYVTDMCRDLMAQAHSYL